MHAEIPKSSGIHNAVGARSRQAAGPARLPGSAQPRDIRVQVARDLLLGARGGNRRAEGGTAGALRAFLLAAVGGLAGRERGGLLGRAVEACGRADKHKGAGLGSAARPLCLGRCRGGNRGWQGQVQRQAVGRRSVCAHTAAPGEGCSMREVRRPPLSVQSPRASHQCSPRPAAFGSSPTTR